MHADDALPTASTASPHLTLVTAATSAPVATVRPNSRRGDSSSASGRLDEWRVTWQRVWEIGLDISSFLNPRRPGACAKLRGTRYGTYVMDSKQ